MVESSSTEAILFFDDSDVAKEMTYAEFQAILDNYVPLQDIAAKAMKAAYLRVDSHLHITAAVFFRIAFDRQGFVEKSWNIPLQQLADNASKGPDLGSGPIALACFSQCPLDWHKNNLWDPNMQAPKNDFLLIKKMIKNNSLGLVFKKKEETSQELNEVDRYHDERTRAALIIKEQRLRHKLLNTKAEQDKRQLSLDHQERLLAYQQQLNEYQQELNEQKAINLELRETISGQADKLEGLRDYFESKLQLAQDNDEDEIEALKEHYESEMLLRVESALAEYKSELHKRDVELLYRSERESKLQQEILTLQGENQQLLEMSGDEVLHQLDDAGVNFVIYHPGVGHLTIQAVEISEYLDNATAFVAKQCGVNEHLYHTWLDHFYSPTCQHEQDNGELCDKPVVKLEDPSQFIIGESDRCSNHQAQTPSVVSISKNGRQAATYSANKT
ncbi:MAG: sodium:proton antiporter [Cellvibrionaceae bacterium]